MNGRDRDYSESCESELLEFVWICENLREVSEKNHLWNVTKM